MPLCRLPISPRYLVLIKVSIAVSVAWYANFSVFFANFGTTSNISSNSCFALASEPESIRDIGVTLFKPAHVFSTEFACNSSPSVCGPENLLEASAPTPCGWGSLAIDIAKSAKCEVTGITLSENQLKYCIQKAKKMNLENQVKFKLIDYRELNEKFDRIVSVGMFEHVGRKFYRTYFNTVSKLLNEKGIALIHTIGSTMPPRDPQPWITKYIFPGGYTPSLSEAVKPIEDSGLIISDIEVLRLHYAHTLRHWKERFLSKKDAVLDMFDEKFFRMWEFYLASCEMAFKWGDQVVFQFQLTKDNTSVPNTRDYIY